MDFNVESEISIFDPLLKKRPELSLVALKKDLSSYYLPYAQKLIDLKAQKNSAEGILVGVSAIQGVGKTTQGEILEILLKHFGHSTVSISIDDHYITHKQLCELRAQDPRFIRRGVTHDIDLAKRDLKKLQTMDAGKAVLISGYDKGAQSGDGDRLRWIVPIEKAQIKIKVIEEELMVNKQLQKVRAVQVLSANYGDQPLVMLDDMGSDLPVLEHFMPVELVNFLSKQMGEIVVSKDENGTVHFIGEGEINIEAKLLPNGWRIVFEKPDFIFYDGWMLGSRSVEDESVFGLGLPALETPEAQEFAKFVNKKLLNYVPLWGMIEFLTVLYVVNYQDSLAWRDHAEEALRAKGEGMSHEQIKEFVYYFWRSVHPGIHIKNLAKDSEHTNQVVIINDDHTVKEVLTPDEVVTKYP